MEKLVKVRNVFTVSHSGNIEIWAAIEDAVLDTESGIIKAKASFSGQSVFIKDWHHCTEMVK